MSIGDFDTCTAAKHLRDAGFEEGQAEAAVSMVRSAAGADREQLAAKAGLASLEARRQPHSAAGLSGRLQCSPGVPAREGGVSGAGLVSALGCGPCGAFRRSLRARRAAARLFALRTSEHARPQVTARG